MLFYGKPDLIAFSTLVCNFHQAHKMQEATWIFGSVESLGLDPNTTIIAQKNRSKYSPLKFEIKILGFQDEML